MLSFNSTLVRFKLKPFLDKIASVRGFNSTLVRFKQGRAKISKPQLIAFQFHSGSIQTGGDGGGDGGGAGFQFHSGSIQTCYRFCFIHKKHRSFNSTLVRFKPVTALWVIPLPIGFNSTLVRFKLPDHSLLLSKLLKFQFHSGSIQTMVRDFSGARSRKFQFHSGSIQTCRDRVEKIRRSLFQFHSGSIQTSYVNAGTRANSRFQFHSGSIQTFLGDAAGMRDSSVSIPLWFDSNLK